VLFFVEMSGVKFAVPVSIIFFTALAAVLITGTILRDVVLTGQTSLNRLY
jgi:hypothetical protein